ncbi:accessory gene regulator B family protein [Ruminococcoides bili]|jgi:accessory gene regulator B|uniref:accessory gene regulator ArgB-like protein n=1 Tax=uncultured Ruminococcus sp. TaxID=165186 RepID=UPI0026662B93|nr:accessory gene regulator B family protein [uncultured Ruminococcus sp.]
MIKLISDKFACFLCKDEGQKDNFDLYEYAVYIILASAFHIITIIALGLCFNLLVESLVFYLSFIVIRKFAGGYHAKTPTRCYIISIITIVLMLCIIKWILIINYLSIYYSLFFSELVCVLILCFLSPLDTENKLLNGKERTIYKIVSCVTSIAISLFSTFLIVIGVYNICVSLSFSIFTSTVLLIVRKVQLLQNLRK